MNERGVKEEKSSLYEIRNNFAKYVLPRKKKKRSDDLRDPDMIIATWRVVHHNLKIESQRLGFTLSKPSL